MIFGQQISKSSHRKIMTKQFVKKNIKKNCQKQTQRDDRCTFRGCIDGIPMAETSVFWFWQANYGYGWFHLDLFIFQIIYISVQQVHLAFKKSQESNLDGYFTKNFYGRASVFTSTLGILLGFGTSGSDGWKVKLDSKVLTIRCTGERAAACSTKWETKRYT